MIEAKYSEYLDKVRKICFALPEVKEVEAWGHPTFRAPKKLFAAFGVDEIEGPNLGLKMSFERQEQLLEDPRFYPTPYAAHQGWVSLRLKSVKRWQEVKALLIEAYCQVASKKLIEALDAD
ncbi:MmcQ/YjbR family DNA-binding protein [Telmatocola sphagniphila]|uniref:MmcQ/YjbR family DNA-binding protein n=1 Tax=Telmatocola sphagniphila TaxID=1123043 RepID=A0A8E6B5V7_9BACT|nr:MmcQ/YjbR family DNA-binding protein [Telmatocola sphagniphila]QVL30965.1 MmcQ/YjbR family DNA-binding protein [Telmatocola sphagniphila]